MGDHAYYYLTLLVLCVVFFTSYGFNIDLKHAIVKETPDSQFYFGYSVAQHSITNETMTPKYDRILVGAPHASSSTPALSGSMRTGALYSCPVDLSNPQTLTNDCLELPYPDTAHLQKDFGSGLTENKTDMWLGVSIRSAGAGKGVVACGHRYKLIEDATNVYGLGVCYFYQSNLQLATDIPSSRLPCTGQILIPTSGSISVASAYGLCAAGMGLAASENDVVYGIPGAGIWRGSVSWTRDRPFPDSDIATTLDIPIISNSIPATTSPYSYLGSSSIIVANLLNDLKKMTVLGAPRQDETGAVVVFELDQSANMLKKRMVLNGSQFGAGFGHSVAAIDIKNDDHPALVVGAPYYRSTTGDNKDSSRSLGGAVHVFYNFGNGISRSNVEIITAGACQLEPLECSNAQFGYAVSDLGDLNGDGYNDLAVGAPFYGQGAIFIYNGMGNYKFSLEPSQVIMASELDFGFLSRPISGFGVSISGGHDMDEQAFTDILVGAFNSSHAVVLRSKPVVTINGAIRIVNTELDPKNLECLAEPTSATPCIDYKICFTASFTDISRNSASESISVKYNLTGDSGYEFPNNRRVVYNLTKPGSLNSVYMDTITLVVNGVEACIDQHIFLPYVNNLLKPIEFSLTYKLIAPDNVVYRNLNADPVMDIYAGPAPIASIDFKRECDTQNCETDLAVSAMFTDVVNVIAVNQPGTSPVEQYAFDSNKVSQLDLTVTVRVDQTKDQAYEPHLYVFLQPELSYVGVADAGVDESASCSGNTETNTVVCDFDRAIPPGGERKVTLTLNFQKLGSTFSAIKILVNTTSEDILLANNNAELQVKVNIVTDLELLGSVTKGDTVEYGGGEIKGASSMKSDDEIGDLVQHTYTILNSGDYGVISKVSLVVQWPYEIASTGEFLLYMVSFPKLEDVDPGKGQCKVSDEYINSLALEIVNEDPVEETSTIRYKRDVKKTASIKEEKTGDGSSSRTIADLNCYERTAKCFNVTCEFFDIQPRDVIRVRFNSRLWNSSLAQDFGTDVDVVQITSTGHLYIDPQAKVSQINTKNDGTNVTTEATSVKVGTDSEGIKIWIIVVAVLAGIIFLIIIIVILWRCGFFKRDRPPTYAVKVEKPKEGVMYNQVPQSDPLDPVT